MINTSRQLKAIVEAAHQRLIDVPADQAGTKPFPDKWSRKEILGHLIDSAANNHQRFVRMQEVQDLGTFRYSQNHWVSCQKYQQEPWPDIVELWYHYNIHLAHVIANVSPASLTNLCSVGELQPITLKFMMEDYLSHLNHHLAQIFSDQDPLLRQPRRK